jgi:4-amino-4-deoxy-L-arabinose transferase-like glycosyltransferase
LPLIDRDEPRFAEASREMLQRGDYIVPYFNNHYRFDKPPFTYWCQIASYRAFGDNDFAARFPSLIAAALTALILFEWGRRVGNERVGWWAAIIFTLCLQTFVHAKAAVADMWLVLFVTLAHWVGYELLRDGLTNSQGSKSNPPQAGQNPTFFWWWIFYLALAFGFLAKGPIAWTPLLTVGSTIFFARNVELARRFKFVRGILLTLALVSIWGIPALIQTHGDFFRVGVMHHVVARSFSTMEGHGASSFGAHLLLLPFYFVTIFASFFPWSIKLPWLAKRLWRKRDKIDNYLFAGSAIIFLIFTLVQTKLPHYTLSAFPLLALLLARHLMQANVATKTFARIAGATAIALLAIALIAPPIVAKQFPSAQLFQQSRASLTRGMEFGAIDYNEPSVVWYFRSRIDGFMTPLSSENAAQFMQKPAGRFVIVPTTLVTQLFPAMPENWKKFNASAFNVPKGKHVDLTLVLKPD